MLLTTFVLMMRIGMDAKRVVSNATGLGGYGRTLVGSLSALLADGDELRLYVPTPGRAELRSQIEGLPHTSLALPAGGVGGSLWRSWAVTAQLRADGVDLYHGLSGELPLGLRRAGIPGVVTIHDLIFLPHPEFYAHRLDTLIYAWKFRHTLREASHVIAISECTRRDILRYGDIEPERVSVIYQSCEPRYAAPVTAAERTRVAARYRLPARYIIGVGTIERRKNMLLAVQALAALPCGISLVLVGRATPYAAEIRRRAETLGVASRLMMLHGVPGSDLAALYQGAEAAVYPSRYEGFGLPVVEAIQSGLPVVAATGSCLEEAGGPHALYVDPDDPRAMAQAVASVLRGAGGREERVARCREYVRRFEGRDVAGEVLEVYRRVRAERA